MIYMWPRQTKDVDCGFVASAGRREKEEVIESAA